MAVSAAVAAAFILCIQSSAPSSAQTAQPQGAAPAPRKPQAPPQARKPAPAKQTAPAAQPQQHKGPSLCVISTLGRKFHVQRIGVMVFGNALDVVPIESWGIDDAITRKTAQLAGNDFAVRRVTVPPAVLAAFEKPQPFSGLTGPNPVEQMLRATAASTARCDFFLLLQTRGSQFSGNQVISGLGIVDRQGIFDRIFVFANFFISLYDGDTFKRLRMVTPHSVLGVSMPEVPSGMHKQVDRSWIPNPPQAAAQSAQLKNTVRALVEEGLAKKLPGLFEPEVEPERKE